MIRFIDITQAYFRPHASDKVALEKVTRQICAFINTTDNKFLDSPDGGQIFHDEEEIMDHIQGKRMLALVPPGFSNLFRRLCEKQNCLV